MRVFQYNLYLKVAEERLSNIRTVQAFTQEEKEKYLYNEKINGVLNLSFKEALAKGVFWAMVC